MELEVENTEVISSNNIQIEIPDAIEISEGEKDYEVRVVKKEYTIIGDSIFIPSMYEDAPPWLKEFINTTIEIAVTNRDQSLIDRMEAILTAMDYVPKNQYTEQINQIVSQDGIINSRIATLNSNFTDAITTTNATVAEINSTYASKEEAAAIASNIITASLSSSGQIGSALITLQEAYANLEETSSSQLSIMEAAFGEFAEGTTEEVNSIRAYAEGVESKFAYNSNLKINGITYESGFGLATSLTTGSGIPIGDSEFWIKADKFRLTSTDSDIKSSYNPFTVDSGTGEITFNGKVLVEGMPEEINKFIGNFYDKYALDSYLSNNPDIVVNAGDTYRHTGTDVVYMWTGTAWTSTGAELVVKSMVFKRSNTKPSVPVGGTYEDPTPEGWEDGIPYVEGGDYVAAEPVWSSVCSFSNKVDYVVNPPVWSEPVLAIDSSTVDYMYNSLQSMPAMPTNTSDSLLVSAGDYANGWRNVSEESSVWMAVRTKNAGKWGAWQVIRVKGEVGKNGEAGAKGERGSLVAHASGTTNSPSGAVLSSAITSIAGSNGAVKAGDVVIWTNTSSSGGTEIYTYNGATWGINTALKINGNAVIDGTIFANKIATYNLTSSNATIGNALIGTAHIKDLAVDTIKI